MALKYDVEVYPRSIKIILNLYDKQAIKKLLFTSEFNTSKLEENMVTVSSDPRFETKCIFQSKGGNKITLASAKNVDKKEWLGAYFGNKKDIRVMWHTMEEAKERLSKKVSTIMEYNIELLGEEIALLTDEPQKLGITQEDCDWIKKTFSFIQDQGIKYGLFQDALEDTINYIPAKQHQLFELFWCVVKKFYNKDCYDSMHQDITKNGVFIPYSAEWNPGEVVVKICGCSWNVKEKAFKQDFNLLLDNNKLGQNLVKFIEGIGYTYKGNNEFYKNIDLI